MPDYYEILEVQEGSTLAEIKKSYRTLSMKWHPDRNKEPHAETKFKTINEAYETLGDEEKRRLYDETRKNHHIPQNVYTQYYTYQPPLLHHHRHDREDFVFTMKHIALILGLEWTRRQYVEYSNNNLQIRFLVLEIVIRFQNLKFIQIMAFIINPIV